MKFNDIKNRVISTLLTTALLLTSSNLNLIPVQAAPTTPKDEHGAAFNPDWEIQELKDDVAGALVPRVQMLRVTLMKTVSEGTDDWRKGGMPATKEDIPELVQNHIHMVPDNYKAIWGGEINEYNIRSPKNMDLSRRSRGLNQFNSRREYLSDDKGPNGYVLAYGATWKDGKDENGNVVNSPQWVFNDSKFNTEQIMKVFPDKCVGNTVSGIGGDAKAFYQDNPPIGTNIDSSMSSAEYFDAISKAVFIDSDFGSDSMKQAFIYHIIADMLGYPNDPYCEEVERVVQEKIITKQYKILVEPMITFDVRKSSDLKAMFGDIEYISLTAGDLRTEDSISTVFFGASGIKSMYKDVSASRYRGFNPITHGQSSSSFMYKFYESVMLKGRDEAVQLYSVGDKEYFNNEFNEGTQWSIDNGHAYDNRVQGPLLNGQKGASITNAFYRSTAYMNNAKEPLKETGVTCKVDMMSMLHTGAMYILPISYDKVDYKADTLVPYNNSLHRDSQPITELNNSPVYDRDSIYVDENGLNCIDIKAVSSLNFDNDITNTPATQWNNKISLNNITNLTKDNAYIKQIDSEALKGTVFIPAITKNLLYVEYADKNGDSMGTIQFDTNGGVEKERIENAHMYGFGKDATGKFAGVPVSMSVSNHSKGNEDRRDDKGELCVGHNLPTATNNGNTYNIYEDKSINDSQYMKLALPIANNLPNEASYLRVVFQVNRGKFEDGNTYMANIASRPQGKESIGGDMPCVLTDTAGGEPEYLGECEHNFDNNTMIIYIKLDNSLDLSADSITRGSSPIITKDPIKVSQCNISTTATANEGAIKSYPTSTVTQTLYYYFSNTNTNEFQNVYNTATDNTDWTNPNVLAELVTKYDAGLPTVNGKKITQTTHIKPTSGIDPMDIVNWNECAISPEVDPNQTIYLHLALVVNPDNNIPNEETYKNNIVFKTYPYDIPDDPLPPPSSPALSCYVPTGSSTGLPLRILNNSTPTNYITGILNSKVLEANNDPNKVEGSLDSHYGAKIRVNGVSNDRPTGYRPDPQYEEIDSIVVGRCNGENEQEEPDDTPEWVFYDEDDLIFHEIAFKYLSYDPVKKRYYVATQILPYTKRVIEHTPCDCEDGCSSPTVTYHYYRLCPTQTVDYTLIFDDLYTQDSNVSSAYSLESLLNQEDDKGRYWYIATNGSLVGLTLRTRLISDFPNFSNTTDKSTGAGVPLGGIVQLADSRGVFNSNNNIKADLELTDFEYVHHISNDYNSVSGGSGRAGAVDKSNDYYSNILLAPFSGILRLIQ